MTIVRSPKRGPNIAVKPTGMLPLRDIIRLSMCGWPVGAHDSKSNDDAQGVGEGQCEDLLREHANGETPQDHVRAALRSQENTLLRQ